MPIADQLLVQLLADCKSPVDLMGEQGLLCQLTTKLAERAIEAEMEYHLGYAKNAPAGKKSGNSHKGKPIRMVRSVHGEIKLEVPRDRNSTFATSSCSVSTRSSLNLIALRKPIQRQLLAQQQISAPSNLP